MNKGKYILTDNYRNQTVKNNKIECHIINIERMMDRKLTIDTKASM